MNPQAPTRNVVPPVGWWLLRGGLPLAAIVTVIVVTRIILTRDDSRTLIAKKGMFANGDQFTFRLYVESEWAYAEVTGYGGFHKVHRFGHTAMLNADDYEITLSESAAYVTLRVGDRSQRFDPVTTWDNMTLR